MTGNKIWSSIKSEVEFLNQYPTLVQATSDNEAPIAGYLFGEINALTYDGRSCKPIVDFLITKAEGSSHAVKFKALKMLLYLARNGHESILEEIKLYEVQLKELAGTCKPSQNFLGKSYHEDIRKMAKELLAIVFSDSYAVERVQEASYKGIQTATGYGSQATTKKLTGFGNVPIAPRSIGERVTEGFTNLVDKMLSPTNENEFYKKQAALLSEGLPQYRPVTIEKTRNADTYLTETLAPASSKDSTKSNTTFKSQKPIHVPGRAGGGWDDSDEEIEPEAIISFEDSTELSISADSLDNKKELVPSLEFAEEHSMIEDFAIDAPLEKLKYDEILLRCKRCSSLNCDKILEFLIDKLASDQENVKLRCLVLIEYLLQQDIINLESLTRIVIPSLKLLAESEKTRVQMKSKKICLIVDALSKVENSPKINKAPLTLGR